MSNTAGIVVVDSFSLPTLAQAVVVMRSSPIQVLE